MSELTEVALTDSQGTIVAYVVNASQGVINMNKRSGGEALRLATPVASVYAAKAGLPVSQRAPAPAQTKASLSNQTTYNQL